MDYVSVRDKMYKVKKGTLNLKNKGINDISEISGLNNLIGLKVLDLSNNNIMEIKDLENFGNLFSLDLSYNRILEIQGLETLTNLRFLKLSNNKINEIKGLDSLKNLMTLYLDGNQINELKGLENVKKLNALYLAGNNISEVKGIEHLASLKRFDLRVSPLVPKDQIKRLKTTGVHLKDQNYFGKRFLKHFMWYCIGIAIADALLTWAIVVGFQMDITAFLPIFGIIYGLLFIFSPLLYVIAKIYYGV